MMLIIACLYFFLLYKTHYLNKEVNHTISVPSNLKTQAELITTIKSFTTLGNDAEHGMLIFFSYFTKQAILIRRLTIL
jgi:hypothetical protein